MADQNKQLEEKKQLMIEEEELIQKLEKQNSELNLIYKKLGSLDEP